MAATTIDVQPDVRMISPEQIRRDANAASCPARTSRRWRDRSNLESLNKTTGARVTFRSVRVRRGLVASRTGRNGVTDEAERQKPTEGHRPGVRIGGAIASVELDVAGRPRVASITVKAIEDLGIQDGTEIVAVIKASAVMLDIN